MTLVEAPTGNHRLLRWVEEMVALCEPDSVHWFDGSDAEHELLCKQPGRGRHLRRPRPAKKRPDSFWARSDAERRRPRRGPHLHLLGARDRRRAHQQLEGAGRDAGQAPGAVPRVHARGRTMYVVPFSMGPLGSPLSYIGVEITDSPYVAVSMRTMTRAGQAALDVLGDDGDFVPVRALGGRAAGAGRGRRPVAVQPRREVDRALPRDARDLVVRLRLRRQRPARQEVLRAAHRLGDRATRAGSPSTCSSSRSRAPKVASATSRRRSRRRAARPTSPCSSRPSRAGRSRRSATTSRG